MKRVIVKSVYDAFEYVMDHYYPYGLEELASRNDTYAVISIQDSHTGGFGIRFEKSQCCKDVLTLYFDDIEDTVEGAVLFNEEMARSIIDFINDNRSVDTLLLHCYGGLSRSKAAGAFAVLMLGGNNEQYSENGSYNQHVYATLMKVYLNEYINSQTS